MTPAAPSLEDRASALDMLDWLAQRRAAADELWALGYTPESYAIMRQGLSDAAALLGDASDVPEALRHDLQALLAEADGLAVPRTRSEFGRAHAAWLERARVTTHDLQRALTRTKPRRSRRIGWLSAGAIALLAVALAGLWIWRNRVYAFASDSYAAETYPAAHVTDGLRATEWLLPDGKKGHVDLSLAMRRPVHAVTIINAHNRAFMDRAIKKAVVLVLDDNLVVDRAAVSFDKIETKPAPKRVALKGKDATRVRIMITEYHGLGGGIADVSIE